MYFNQLFVSRDLLIHLQNIVFEQQEVWERIGKQNHLCKECCRTFDFRFDSNVEMLFVNRNDSTCVTIAKNRKKVSSFHSTLRWDRSTKYKWSLPQPRVIKQYNLFSGSTWLACRKICYKYYKKQKMELAIVHKIH